MSEQRKKVVKELDRLVSLIVRERDGRCVQSGYNCASEEKWTPKGNILTNGHLFTRAGYKLRWDLRPDGNCHCQCWACNRRHVYRSEFYNAWYVHEFGAERYEELVRESKRTGKYSTVELIELLEKLKQIANQMKIAY